MIYFISGQTESIPELSDEVESDGNDITTDTSNTNELSTAKVKETQQKVNKLALGNFVCIQENLIFQSHFLLTSLAK